MQKQRRPSEIIEDFINLMKDAQKQYSDAKKQCEDLDSMDRHVYWVHEFEFADKAKRGRLGTAFQKERRKRREYKDVVDLYKYVNDFACSDNNKAILKRLGGMLPLQKRQEEYLKSDRRLKDKAGDNSVDS